MDKKHVKDMLELTLEQLQNDGNKQFVRKLLKIRLEECRQNKTYRVIYADCDLAGFIRWNWAEEGAILEALLIRHTYRRQGYMEKLWKELLDECKARGVKRVISYAEKEDYLNMSFHQHLGFILTNESYPKKYKWIYEIKEAEEVRISMHNLIWLKIPDIDGEL